VAHHTEADDQWIKAQPGPRILHEPSVALTRANADMGATFLPRFFHEVRARAFDPSIENAASGGIRGKLK
jgi:hypothetical protein